MLASAATGLILGAAAHATGWPFISGGGGALTQALANYLGVLGGRIETSADVTTLDDLPPADVTLFNTSAATMSRIAGPRLSASFQTRLAHFQPGPGIFKIDYALSEPIPWRDPVCRRAGTIHLGGSLDEIVASEDDAFRGRHNDFPFVLVTQPSLFDASRAPDGKHTAWAYCHVPNGSPVDRTGAIERQIERFAPGFHDCVLARRTWSPQQLESWNPNLLGGDISAGAMTLGGMLARPTLRHWRTSNPQLYLASAATPPGGGVHGMCGHLAALAALKDHS
jgi:phytoene dehydrogenase-like protein